MSWFDSPWKSPPLIASGSTSGTLGSHIPAGSIVPLAQGSAYQEWAAMLAQCQAQQAQQNTVSRHEFERMRHELDELRRKFALAMEATVFQIALSEMGERTDDPMTATCGVSGGR